jgi:hypothetical protein
MLEGYNSSGDPAITPATNEPLSRPKLCYVVHSFSDQLPKQYLSGRGRSEQLCTLHSFVVMAEDRQQEVEAEEGEDQG